MAAQRGQPWTTHQHAIATLIGQRAGPGYRYTVVVVTIPRQCGKTSLVFDLMVGRCIDPAVRHYRALYGAQDGTRTSTRFRTDFIPAITASPLGRSAGVRLRRQAGSETVAMGEDRYLMAMPSDPDGIRGLALDAAVVDEAQEHGEARGLALDEAIMPTFATRPRRQLIVIGTAGTAQSAYLARYLEQARAGVPGFGLIEYGCPDDVDPTDPTRWAEWHPGLVSGLIDTAALHMALGALGPEGFAREYGNQWTRTRHETIDPAQWAAAQAPDAPKPTGPACLALDVAADRGSAAVAIATEAGYVELVQTGPGVEWVADTVTRLSRDHRHPVAADRYGAAGPIVEQLERNGVDLIPMAGSDAANAAAGFLDRLAARTLTVYPSAALDDAVAGAVRRHVGDSGGFVWARSAAAAEVAPLRAACAALWAAQNRPQARPQAYAL